MASLFFFGFLLGMRHAMEADHLAAIATICTNTTSRVDAIRHGAAWGLGHTLTLFVFGLVLFAFDTAMSNQVALWLEGAVGVLLVLLGIDVIRQVIRSYRHTRQQNRTSFNGQTSDNNQRASATTAETIRTPSSSRSLLVGLMHGMAGSAALSTLAAKTTGSIAIGLLYILVIGLGSLAGMAILSVIIAVPLRATGHTSRTLQMTRSILHAAVGLISTGIGGFIVLRTTTALA